MGASLSLLLANIFLENEISKLIAENQPIEGLTMLYADDLLHIGPTNSFIQLVNRIENNISTMPITIEYATTSI